MVLKNTGRTHFKKGYTPWNKGLKGWTKGTKAGFQKNHKINVGIKGTVHTEETKLKISLTKAGVPSKRKGISKGFVYDGGYIGYFINGKRIPEHHIVYCESHNIKNIPNGYNIHHINGKRDDNRIENLILLTISDHAKLHWKQGDIK